MRFATVAFLLATATTPALAQMSSPFSRMFLARSGNGGASSFSSSFVSSSSWVSGADGQMHQETHEVRRETTRDVQTGQMVQRKQSEVNCKDGDCTKMVQFTAAAPRLHERLMARFFPRLMTAPDLTSPGMRPGGLAPNGLPAGMELPYSHPPVIQEPVVVVRVSPGFLAPRLPPTMHQATAYADSEAYRYLLGGGAAVAAAASVIAIATLLKCHRSGEAKARERPIRELAQPLTRQAEAQMKCGAAVCPAIASAAVVTPLKVEAMYLTRVYNKAAEMADMRVTRGYLARLYSKVI